MAISRRIRSDLGSTEWKMGLCLLALKRNGAFRKLGYATLTDYAERVLDLSGRKTGSLIGAAEALEHLPLMSEAFRRGQICWGKVRAIRGLATPETERQWLDFAAAHRTGEVERKVALSPRAWKRHKALEASLQGQPIVRAEEVEEILVGEISRAGECQDVRVGSRAKESSLVVDEKCSPEIPVLEQLGRSSGKSSVHGGPQCAEHVPSAEAALCLPPTPSPPKTIRLVFELTPDQYALYEQAESRVRARRGRRIPRAEVLEQMAGIVLSQGTARARARHQVLIHTFQDGDQAWYDTERGLLPVGSEVLDEAFAKGEVLSADSLKKVVTSPEDGTAPGDPSATPVWVSRAKGNVEVSRPEKRDAFDREPADPTPVSVDVSEPEAPGKRKPQPRKRTAIPNSTLRQLFVRSGHRCEQCGAKGGRLDVHHTTPVSEGGGNALRELEVLCRACHTLNHEEDLAKKPRWRAARRAARQRALVRGPCTSSRSRYDSGGSEACAFRECAQTGPPG